MFLRKSKNTLHNIFKRCTEGSYYDKIAVFLFKVRDFSDGKAAEALSPDEIITCCNTAYFYTSAVKFIDYFIGSVPRAVNHDREDGAFELAVYIFFNNIH